MTTDMFKHQSERISIQLQELADRKIHLQSALKARQIDTDQLQTFIKAIEHLSVLDIKDESILKQVLQRLIDAIEIYEGGKIKIHYNLFP
ncbi:hypothetical protein [Bacillus cereus]|uniref:hypothetical protein n=1 Tax=Bacillus cereus TaxID=1396 RepID=UPI001E5387E1|nr:hypothetical protein [Bacillus cereus]